MFSLVSGLYDSYLAPVQLNVLVVGSPGTGKTALLERIKVTQALKRPPAIVATKDGVVPVPPELERYLVEGGMPTTVAKLDPSSTKSTTTAKTVESSKSTASTTITAGARSAPINAFPPAFTPPKSKRRFPLSFCPAPERYRKNDDDQDEDILFDDEDEDDGDDGIVATPPKEGKDGDRNMNTTDEEVHALKDPENDEMPPMSSTPPRRVRIHSKEFSMSSIDLTEDDDDAMHALLNSNHGDTNSQSPAASPQHQQSKPQPSLYQESDQQYDVRSKAKMLPLNKIRPTIGTNLAKLELCGAKCHFFDVGGKMQALWERYYDDCDAVIFVWKVGEKNASEDDDDDDEEPYDYAQQHSTLQQVRSSIGDDVPFLVLGQTFGGNLAESYTQHFYSTDKLLPHYHNPNMKFTCASASTGVGVRHAMEWLIPLAKQQLKERQIREAKAIGDEREHKS